MQDAKDCHVIEGSAMHDVRQLQISLIASAIPMSLHLTVSNI